MRTLKTRVRSWAIAMLLLCCCSSSLLAQSKILKDYDWEEKPVLHKLSEDELAEQKIILKDKRVIEFFYDEENQLHEYSLKHKIIRVNSDKAIQYNNRIYIPFSNNMKVVREKARVINSEGKVRELKEEDIREAKDEETNQTYRYFAVEGVDIGSEVEYYYLVDKFPNYMGSLITLQEEETVKNAAVEIISPKNLIFAVKSYNGLPEMQNDTAHEELNYLKVEADRIPPLKQEESATYLPHLMQLIYKLDKDLLSGQKNMVSYDDAAKAVYLSVYGEMSGKADKKLRKLIGNEKFDVAGDQKEQVRKVENYIKSNFTIVDYAAAELADVEEMLDSKVCNEVGVTKLLAAIYKRLGIPHRIVLTSDRNSLRFDPEFEAYNFLQHYVIYFPEIDLYLAPTMTFMRLGFIPPGWTHNYGLFLEPFAMGDFETALPKINFIEAPGYEESTDNLQVNVQFDMENIGKLNIKVIRESKGYYALNTQPYYDLLNEAQKSEVSESIIKNISPDAVIHSIRTENEGSTLFGAKPFVVIADITSGAFIEKAGPKYLFKVGELIGPQIEMYQEEERKLEVETDFARKYHRVIRFNVPEGYEMKNLDKLNMDVNYAEEGDTLMTFNAHYERKEDQVTVTIIEYYKQVVYPLELFPAYRKVINAAADFNKVTLILEEERD